MTIQKKNHPIVKFINGVSRFAVGLPLLLTTFAIATARATIGTAVNATKAVGGAVGALVVGSVHILNFGKVQAIKGCNAIIGRTPKTPANTDFTRGMFNVCKEYTKTRAVAARDSFHNVFSGEQDKKYKARLAKFFEAKDEAIIDQKQTETTRESFSIKPKKTYKEIIDSIPNTWEVISKSMQLIQGKSPSQRREDDAKIKKTRTR